MDVFLGESFFALWIEASGIESFEVGCFFFFRFNVTNDWMMKWGVKVVIVTGGVFNGKF